MAGQYPGNSFGPPRQSRPPGPLGVPGKVLCCLLPVLTAGLLGFVPALVLAVRRKRRSDVTALVSFMALLAVMLVCAGIAGQDRRQVVANGLGITAMVLMAFAPPVHFLLMDRRVVWERQAHPPQPLLYPYPSQPQQPPADDLQQLGELLRRQAGGQAGGQVGGERR